MRDKFERAKELALRHRAVIGYVVGVAVGSALTYHSMKNRRVVAEVLMQETPEQIMALFEKNGAIDIIGERGSMIIIRSGVDPLKVG
jgi:hypothetical protein